VPDLVADRADLLDRQAVRIGDRPVLVALPCHSRADAVAGSDHDVRPGEVVVVQAVLDVVGGVDPDLAERLDHRGLGTRAVRVGAGGAGLVPLAGRFTEETLRHHASPAVAHPDEEDVHLQQSQSQQPSQQLIMRLPSGR
jgi:hypothetical protein